MLKLVYDKQEDIPEKYRDLFTERDGKWHLTQVEGLKTQSDVNAVHASLEAERQKHDETKAKLKPWDGLDPTETREKLDRIPELEAAAEGKLNDDQINEMVDRRVEARINTKTAPLEREIEQLNEKNTALTSENDGFRASDKTRRIHESVRGAATESKVRPEAMEDILMNADRCFDIDESGNIVTKDGVGVTPGVSAKTWITDMQPKRRYWWPDSQGGGAPGGSGGGSGGHNPWTDEHWNMSKQNEIRRGPNGNQKAAELMQAAGSVDGRRPRKKTS